MVNTCRPSRTVLAAAVLLLLSAGLACGGSGAAADSSAGSPGTAAPETRTATGAHGTDHVPSLAVHVLATHPHRKDAFTQGLLWDDGVLYESTGQYGASSLRKVDLDTGEVLETRDLAEQYFGEGLALVPGDRGDPEGDPSARGDQLIQLTWKSGVALVWDRNRLEEVGEHDYSGEGWGLTFDGSRLVMSDGSSWLTFRDPQTFEELSRVRVTLEGRPLSLLNELEWVDGAVWANVWGSTLIVRIDPASGNVTATADLGLLYDRIDPAEAQGMDVLNGIAYRPGAAGEGAGGGGVFLVTGKYWPLLFEVTFEPDGA